MTYYDDILLIIHSSKSLKDIETIPEHICEALAKLNSGIPRILLQFKES